MVGSFLLNNNAHAGHNHAQPQQQQNYGHQHHNHSGNYSEYHQGHTHNFASHADHMLGSSILAKGQGEYGGYAFLGDNNLIARSPITGLQPVIEQAIRQIVGTRTLEQAAKLYGGYDKLESKIANQLTNLNDWEQLQTETQNEIMIMTGINFDAMSTDEREMSINHLLHSPLPFGDLEEVLSTSVKIDLGYTHTLDKNKTEVEDLGNGIWKVYMISNNNNGSHTGHNLGSFKINLGPNADAGMAKQIGNQMVVNTNNNNLLYLDAAARDVLYGRSEKIDFIDDGYVDMSGRAHDFVQHVSMMYDQTLIEGQNAYGGYASLGPNQIIARSTITGLKPVVEQAIQQIVGNYTLEQAAKRYGGYDKLENKIAQQITNLNDWEALNEATQAKLMIMTGVNFDALSAAEREKSINHLLHSPLPFGDIKEVISTSTKIDLGYTHTLDKAKTTVASMGEGIWKVNIISNNNNGSHTGHKMGSFMIDLGPNSTASMAREIGNQMIVNTNDNTKLYLDPAARDVLYGRVGESEFNVDNPFQAVVPEAEKPAEEAKPEGEHNHGEMAPEAEAEKPAEEAKPEAEKPAEEAAPEAPAEEAAPEAPVAAGEHKDVAGETQYVDGEAIGANVFVVNGNAVDYTWHKTNDGTGTVIYTDGKPVDILWSFDTIRFNDVTVKLADMAMHTAGEAVQIAPVGPIAEEKPAEEAKPEAETPVAEEKPAEEADSSDEQIHKDDADQMQFIDAGDGNDVFVIDGKSSDYQWAKASDGEGMVVWSASGADVLWNVETLRFNDKDVDLTGSAKPVEEETDDGKRVEDDADVSQFLVGTDSKNDVFVIDGKKADYGMGETEDGGTVIWALDGSGYDLVWDFEKVEFTDETVDLA